MNLSPDEFSFTLVLDNEGIATLMQGDEQMWTSEGDRDFTADLGETVIDESDLPFVHNWLEKEGYVPPGIEIVFDVDQHPEEEWITGSDEDDDDIEDEETERLDEDDEDEEDD